MLEDTFQVNQVDAFLGNQEDKFPASLEDKLHVVALLQEDKLLVGMPIQDNLFDLVIAFI